jgi:hypothetical protein
MRDLVRYRRGEVILEILGKQVWIVADAALPPAQAVHPGRATAQVKIYRNGFESFPEQRACLLDTGPAVPAGPL